LTGGLRPGKPDLQAMGVQMTDFSRFGQALRRPEAATETGGSFFGPDLVIDGHVKGSGRITVDGRITGKIEAQDLTVGTTAWLDGEADAARMVIAGTVKGTVTAGDLSLRGTADVAADVVCGTLAIESGATITASVRCAKPVAEAPSLAASA
jgi:cytoskeletal protein CcmA (bactofilin family)